MPLKTGVDMEGKVDITRRGGRWDPDKITKASVIPKELNDMILKEFDLLAARYGRGRGVLKRAIQRAFYKWRKKYVDKSGG